MFSIVCLQGDFTEI